MSETCVVMHEDLRGNQRYRAVFDALVEGLSEIADRGRQAPNVPEA
jgi:hypothetical protein